MDRTTENKLSESRMQSFLSARELLFNAIRNGGSELICQGFSFEEHNELCLTYAESYLDLIGSIMRNAERNAGDAGQSALIKLKNILAIDSVHVVLTDFRGKHREALFVAPTHPLRILCLLSWSTLAKEWIQKILIDGKDYLPAVRKALLQGLQAVNFPVGIPVEDGRIFTAVDNLNPFWCVCAPATEDNTRGLIAELCAALGLPEPATVGADVNGAVIAEKIERYLSQHPYIRELSMNIFNPGLGSVIAEALMALQHKREYKNLRYNLNLFSSDPESPALGNSLEQLLKPGNAGKYESSDAFSVSTGNHLFSKMSLAKHHNSEFHAYADKFSAHLSILLDVFPAEEISVCPAKKAYPPLYGLIQDYDDNFIDDESGAFWKKDAAQEARLFLDTIEKGYSLQFRRSAIIFDFEKDGTDAPDNEVGIEFHRIGKDMVQALLNNCYLSISEDSEELVSKDGASISELKIPAVPRLESAAFLTPKRERTTTLDNMGITACNEEDGHIMEQPKDEDRRHQTEKNTEKEPHENADGSPFASPPDQVCSDEISGRKVALDLNHTHTISLFGVQGGGKSYTLGTAIEMASMPIQNINLLPSPLSTVIFHYSPTQDYAPEFTSMIGANTVDEEISILRERYKAEPEALKDILILTPKNKVEQRRLEHPDIEVRPIAFSASELKAAHWKFLMGAIGNQSMYMRQINLIMRGLRNNLTLDAIRNGIESSSLSDLLKNSAQTRLQFASEYIDDSQKLQDLIWPGRLIIVDLRDEYIEKEEALGLFVVMLQIFSEAACNGKVFNKLVVFDEAHKYIENDDLVSGLVEVVREMRHKGASIMVASQDPPSVPVSLIELSSQIIMHRFNSPAWLKHIQKANAALSDLLQKK